MWPFGKKKVRNAPQQVPKPPAATPSPVEIKRPAVRKAISALGLIKPEAEDSIGLAGKSGGTVRKKKMPGRLPI